MASTHTQVGAYERFGVATDMHATTDYIPVASGDASKFSRVLHRAAQAVVVYSLDTFPSTATCTSSIQQVDITLPAIGVTTKPKQILLGSVKLMMTLPALITMDTSRAVSTLDTIGGLAIVAGFTGSSFRMVHWRNMPLAKMIKKLRVEYIYNNQSQVVFCDPTEAVMEHYIHCLSMEQHKDECDSDRLLKTGYGTTLLDLQTYCRTPHTITLDLPIPSGIPFDAKTIIRVSLQTNSFTRMVATSTQTGIALSPVPDVGGLVGDAVIQSEAAMTSALTTGTGTQLPFVFDVTNATTRRHRLTASDITFMLRTEFVQMPKLTIDAPKVIQFVMPTFELQTKVAAVDNIKADDLKFEIQSNKGIITNALLFGRHQMTEKANFNVALTTSGYGPVYNPGAGDVSLHFAGNTPPYSGGFWDSFNPYFTTPPVLLQSTAALTDIFTSVTDPDNYITYQQNGGGCVTHFPVIQTISLFNGTDTRDPEVVIQPLCVDEGFGKLNETGGWMDVDFNGVGDRGGLLIMQDNALFIRPDIHPMCGKQLVYPNGALSAITPTDAAPSRSLAWNVTAFLALRICTRYIYEGGNLRIITPTEMPDVPARIVLPQQTAGGSFVGSVASQVAMAQAAQPGQTQAGARIYNTVAQSGDTVVYNGQTFSNQDVFQKTGKRMQEFKSKAAQYGTHTPLPGFQIP